MIIRETLSSLLNRAHTFNAAQTFAGTVTFDGDLTASGAITLTPTTDTILANGTGLIVGHTAGLTVSRVDLGATLTPEVQILGTASDDASVLLGQFSNDALGPSFIFQKSRNASIGTNTVVADDDRLGTISWQGADGGGNIDTNAAEIYAAVDGSPGTNDMPTRLVMSATPDDSASPAARLTIHSTGNIEISANADAGSVVSMLNTNTSTQDTDANTTETNLYTYTLPAATFVTTGDSVCFHAAGAFGGNTNTKTLRAYVGGTGGTKIGEHAGAHNGTHWEVTARTYRAGEDSQRSFCQITVDGVVVDNQYQASGVDESATIELLITGQNGTASDNDIVKRIGSTIFYPAHS